MTLTQDDKILRALEFADKSIKYDGNLYKVVKVSTVYIYLKAYVQRDILTTNTDIIFYSIGNKNVYKSFLNELCSTVTKQKLKGLYSEFINPEDIEDIYLINNKIHKNYKTSMFYINKKRLATLYEIKFLFASLLSPCMNIENQYYTPIKLEWMNRIKTYFRTFDDETKHKLLDETTRYFNTNEGYYNAYENINIINTAINAT